MTRLTPCDELQIVLMAANVDIYQSDEPHCGADEAKNCPLLECHAFWLAWSQAMVRIDAEIDDNPCLAWRWELGLFHTGSCQECKKGR